MFLHDRVRLHGFVDGFIQSSKSPCIKHNHQKNIITKKNKKEKKKKNVFT